MQAAILPRFINHSIVLAQEQVREEQLQLVGCCRYCTTHAEMDSHLQCQKKSPCKPLPIAQDATFLLFPPLLATAVLTKLLQHCSNISTPCLSARDTPLHSFCSRLLCLPSLYLHSVKQTHATCPRRHQHKPLMATVTTCTQV